MRSLVTLIYKDKVYNNIAIMIKELVKDNMTMGEVRQYLLDLKFTQDEVDYIMTNHYVKFV